MTDAITTHYLDLVELQAPRLRGPESLVALGALNRSRPNWLRCLERADLATGLRFVAALDGYWTTRGLWPEARAYADDVLARLGANGDDLLPLGIAEPLGHVYLLRGNIALYGGDLDEAELLYEKSQAIGERLGNPDLLGSSIHNLGGVALHRQRWDEAVAWFERSIRHDEIHGALRRAAIASTNLGLVAERRDDLELAAKQYTNALERARQIGDERLIGLILNNLAGVAILDNALEVARIAIDESIAHHRRLGSRLGEAAALINLGIWHLDSHQPEEARSRLLDSVRLLGHQGDVFNLLRALAGLAVCEQRHGEPRLAVQIHAFTEATCEGLSSPAHTPRDLRAIEESLETLRQSLDSELFGRAWDEGRSMDLSQLLGKVAPGDTE